MSDWKLRIELGAKQDIRDGFEYYKEAASVEIAIRFRDVVRAGMGEVREAPERWPVFNDEGERHYVIQKFPYVIIYNIRGDTIIVFAVGHTKREPGYYRE